MFKNKRLNYYIDSFLLDKKITVKESTYCRYLDIINNYIRPEFGNMSVKNINKDLLNNYFISLSKINRLNNKTIKDIIVLFKQILRDCNINYSITLPKETKKNIQILTKDEQKILEKELCSNINSFNLGVLICLYTGIRIGELCALRWKDIDINNGFISINHTIIRIKDFDGENKTKVIISSPKTNNSIRQIPVPKQVLNILVNQKRKVDNDNNYLLTNSLKLMEPRSCLNHYYKLIKKINLKKYNFHVLRHTFATRCVELHFDYNTLSEILGHSSVKITLSTYVHPSINLKISSMQKLELY